MNQNHIISSRDNKVGRRVRTHPGDPESDTTVQGEVAQAEIKEILGKYSAVDIATHLTNVDLVYKDVSEFDDYVDMMRHVEQAKQDFMQLRPGIRELFDNDHLAWLDAAQNPAEWESANQDRLVKAGLIEAPEPPAPAPEAPAPAPPEPPAPTS